PPAPPASPAPRACASALSTRSSLRRTPDRNCPPTPEAATVGALVPTIAATGIERARPGPRPTPSDGGGCILVRRGPRAARDERIGADGARRMTALSPRRAAPGRPTRGRPVLHPATG